MTPTAPQVTARIVNPPLLLLLALHLLPSLCPNNQVLELLNHINKRVKALPTTALPLLPLVR